MPPVPATSFSANFAGLPDDELPILMVALSSTCESASASVADAPVRLTAPIPEPPACDRSMPPTTVRLALLAVRLSVP